MYIMFIGSDLWEADEAEFPRLLEQWEQNQERLREQPWDIYLDDQELLEIERWCPVVTDQELLSAAQQAGDGMACTDDGLLDGMELTEPTSAELDDLFMDLEGTGE
jgi:hypothetical protein